MNNQLSRKQFLNHAFAVTGAAALGSMTTTAWADGVKDSYDLEYDVVVIGSGFAGCSAAIEAAKAGSRKLTCLRPADSGPQRRREGHRILRTHSRGLPV